MKYGKDWVAMTAQCPEGMAWGLQYVKDGGKDIQTALAGFNRADWLLWFMVKTGCMPIEAAFDLLVELAAARVDGQWFIDALCDVRDMPPDRIATRRNLIAREAETQMTMGDFRLGHQYSVATFLLRFKLQLISGDEDEALKDGQCVLNNLVAAKTGSLLFDKTEAREIQYQLCDWLRERVKIAKGA